MYKEIISASILKLNEEPNLFTYGSPAKRGSFGKKNIGKAPTCLLLPEFGVPNDQEDSQSNTNPKLQLVCFVVTGNANSTEAAEDLCLDKAEEIEFRLTGEQIEVTRLDGSSEYNDWKLAEIEWIERKQSGCVVALTFEMELWK